jgi:hypothetical protein
MDSSEGPAYFRWEVRNWILSALLGNAILTLLWGMALSVWSIAVPGGLASNGTVYAVYSLAQAAGNIVILLSMLWGQNKEHYDLLSILYAVYMVVGAVCVLAVFGYLFLPLPWGLAANAVLAVGCSVTALVFYRNTDATDGNV